MSRLRPRRDVDTLEDLREPWNEIRPLLEARPGLLERLARVVSTAPAG